MLERERERERERKRENGEMNSKESRAGESEYETVLYGVYQYKWKEEAYTWRKKLLSLLT